MNSVAAIIAAGTAFAGTVVVALLAGAVVDLRSHTHYWVLLFFFAGIILGAYAAWRLIARAVRE